ncbi:MAG: hypothetical protein D8M58_21430 [Calditrichaeota bacterium]|nr:MAG: hypothetical protein DWQ03_00155 [Calditrichota bacterium]MBL1207976.1 hypothetical protein [Calditrichota bacterium]
MLESSPEDNGFAQHKYCPYDRNILFLLRLYQFLNQGLTMKHLFIFIILNLIFLIVKSCSENGVKPPNTGQDTTSHAFTWRIDTLGKYPSFFHDVTVIDENNIWAVGEVTTDSGTYGGAHWDGNKWHLQKFPWDGGSSATPIRCVWEGTDNNLWVAAASIFLWDGEKLNMKWRVPSFGKGVEQIWKIAEDNIYFVGGLGTIVHYNGSSFKELNSNTNIHLRGISGNNKGNVFVTGYEQNGDAVALEIVNENVTELYRSIGPANVPQGNYGVFLSVWTGDEDAYFLTDAGLLTVNIQSRKKILSNNHELTYPFARHDIEGQAGNDLIIVSGRGKAVHWNGSTWSLHTEMFDQYPNQTLTTYGADYRSETVAYAGPYQFGNKAFIVIGKHN